MQDNRFYERFLKINKTRIIFTCICVITIAGLVSLFSVYMNSLIKYEITVSNELSAKEIISPENNVIYSTDDIPESSYYTMYLENGLLNVYDRYKNLVYSSEIAKNALSKSDVDELEKDGIKITARTELMEILNYLKS